MTGIVDEKGARFATYAYDAKGRAISTEHAGGADKTAIDNNADGSSTTTDARVNPYGYGFTTQLDLAKLSAQTGTAVPGIGGKVYSYNANGFLSKRADYNGNVTTYARNLRGLETSRTEAVGTPRARTIKTTWRGTLHLPTKITEPGRTTTVA